MENLAKNSWNIPEYLQQWKFTNSRETPFGYSFLFCCTTIRMMRSFIHFWHKMHAFALRWFQPHIGANPHHPTQEMYVMLFLFIGLYKMNILKSSGSIARDLVIVWLINNIFKGWSGESALSFLLGKFLCWFCLSDVVPAFWNVCLLNRFWKMRYIVDLSTKFW